MFESSFESFFKLSSSLTEIKDLSNVGVEKEDPWLLYLSIPSLYYSSLCSLFLFLILAFGGPSSGAGDPTPWPRLWESCRVHSHTTGDWPGQSAWQKTLRYSQRGCGCPRCPRPAATLPQRSVFSKHSGGESWGDFSTWNLPLSNNSI